MKSSYFNLSPTKTSHSSFDVNKTSFSHSKLPSNIITTNNKDYIKSLKENLNRTQNPTKSTSKPLSDAVGIVYKNSLPKENCFEQVNTSKHNLLDANKVSTALNSSCFNNESAAMSSLNCKKILMPSLGKCKSMERVYNEVKDCFLHYFDVFNGISLPCQSNSHVKDQIDLKVPFLCKTKNNEKRNISKVSHKLTENKKSFMKPLNSQKLPCHKSKDDIIFDKALKNLMPAKKHDKNKTNCNSALPILKKTPQKVPNRTKSNHSNYSDKNCMKQHLSCNVKTIAKVPKKTISDKTLGKDFYSYKLNFHQSAASCNNFKNQLCKDYRNFKLQTSSSNCKITISNKNNFVNTAHTTKLHSKSTAELVATNQKVSASSNKIYSFKSKTHSSISNSLINMSKSSNHVSKRDQKISSIKNNSSKLKVTFSSPNCNSDTVLSNNPKDHFKKI